MRKLLYIFIALFPLSIFADQSAPTTGIAPSGGLFTSSGWTLEKILSYAEEIIIKLVLPLTVVGVTLYVGYHLLTAEGDEEKMKKAFKSLAYGSIGLIAIACAYAFVALISGLKF